MKAILKKKFALLSFLLIISSFISYSYANILNKQEALNNIQKQLDSQIKKQIDEYESKNCISNPENTCRGTEYKKARKFIWGDIDIDSIDDIAVLYTIESFCCGNNYYFYLAVFLNKGSRFDYITSTEVGGKGQRFVDFDSIKNGQIILNTKEYLSDDAMCCPTGKDRTVYTLKDNKLIETKKK